MSCDLYSFQMLNKQRLVHCSVSQWTDCYFKKDETERKLVPKWQKIRASVSRTELTVSGSRWCLHLSWSILSESWHHAKEAGDCCLQGRVQVQMLRELWQDGCRIFTVSEEISHWLKQLSHQNRSSQIRSKRTLKTWIHLLWIFKIQQLLRNDVTTSFSLLHM